MRHALVLLASSLLLVAGCASAPSGAIAQEKASAADPSWQLKGWRIIGCCCTSPCACRINKKPNYCHGCDHTDVVHIDSGEIGGVKMDGVQYTVVGRGFGDNKSSTWAYVYVDERASDAQVKALGDWLSGGVAALAAKAPYLVGEFKGMREVPMTTTVSADKREYAVKIPGILDFQTRSIVNPGHTEPVMSTGIMDAFGDRFVHSNTVKHEFEDKTLDAAWELTGRQSNQAEFAIDSARAAKPGVGWGCWSAHADFGDDTPYIEQVPAKHGHEQ